MAHTLLPDPDALCLDHLAAEEGVIVFHIATTFHFATTARATSCYRVDINSLNQRETPRQIHPLFNYGCCAEAVPISNARVSSVGRNLNPQNDAHSGAKQDCLG